MVEGGNPSLLKPDVKKKKKRSCQSAVYRAEVRCS